MIDFKWTHVDGIGGKYKINVETLTLQYIPSFFVRLLNLNGICK